MENRITREDVITSQQWWSRRLPESPSKYKLGDKLLLAFALGWLTGILTASWLIDLVRNSM